MLRRNVSVLRYVGCVAISLVIWGGGFSWMLVGATLTMLLVMVGVPYQRVHNWVTAPLFVHVVRVFAMTRLRIHYHPGFDPQRRSVFAQNHVNLMDGHVASAAIPHEFSGLMNAWQFWIPIYGWLMWLSKGIGVHRNGRERLIAELTAAAKERKRIGMSILTFPEGHRTHDGSVQSFRRGVFIMARNAEMPVVPIAVRGFFEVNRKGSFLVFPFRTVDVYVGPQYETAGLSDAQVGELANALQIIVAHGVDKGGWPEVMPRVPTPDDAHADDEAPMPRAAAT
jgi:1-acyl-sn-glycerol-3-phosphate acyltransferase